MDRFKLNSAQAQFRTVSFRLLVYITFNNGALYHKCLSAIHSCLNLQDQKKNCERYVTKISPKNDFTPFHDKTYTVPPEPRSDATAVIILDVCMYR